MLDPGALGICFFFYLLLFAAFFFAFFFVAFFFVAFFFTAFFFAVFFLAAFFAAFFFAFFFAGFGLVTVTAADAGGAVGTLHSVASSPQQYTGSSYTSPVRVTSIFLPHTLHSYCMFFSIAIRVALLSKLITRFDAGGITL